jgi:hypothetical protein
MYKMVTFGIFYMDFNLSLKQKIEVIFKLLSSSTYKLFIIEFLDGGHFIEETLYTVILFKISFEGATKIRRENKLRRMYIY